MELMLVRKSNEVLCPMMKLELILNGVSQRFCKNVDIVIVLGDGTV